jgi:putative drug exporter of the RND superfamily
MALVALTRWVLRHRRLVLLAWLALTVAGAAAVTPATRAMTPDFGALPGRPGYETNQKILREYGAGGATDPLVLVAQLPPGATVDQPAVRAELARAFTRIAASTSTARMVSYVDTGDPGLVAGGGRTTFALLYPPAGDQFPVYARSLPAVERAVAEAAPPGITLAVTGTEALFTQSSDATGPGLLAETVVAGLGALLVLALVFGSVLALLPLVMAAVAVLVTFLAVWGLTGVTEVSFVVQFLVGLIGLGVAIDYALLVTTRWREERAGGTDPVTAVERAMATAGAAVVLSGVTVAVGLAALIAIPVPFLRGMGLGGLLIPLVSVLVAVTLLPVLLATLGPRLDRRSQPRAATPAGRRRGWHGWGWHRWAGLVVRRPLLFAIAATLPLAALMLPLRDLRLGAPDPASIAASGPARDALDALAAAGAGPGVLSPEYVLVDGDPAPALARIRPVPGVRAALAPADPAWRRDGTALVAVLVDEPAATAAGRATRDRIREAVAGLPGAHPAGPSAQTRDFVAAVYGSAPLVLTLVVVVTLLLLIRAFRSVVLALKAVLLALLSVAATLGLLVLAWQDGHLARAVWGIDATGALTEWVPVMVFVFLFGLSTDYEVFILARVREEYDLTGSTPQAAVRGLAHTGRLVTSAALILFLAFASLAATPGTEVKVFATALGLGILIDATVIRAALVPALVVLFGRSNWWLPPPLARLLLIRPRRADSPRTEPQPHPGPDCLLGPPATISR